MIYNSDLRFNDYSFRSLLDIYYIERCGQYHLTISLKTSIAESDIIDMIDQRKSNRRNGRSSNRRLPNFGDVHTDRILLLFLDVVKTRKSRAYQACECSENQLLEKF